MINDANTRLSESITNNDSLGVKVAKELLEYAQKSYEKAKASRELEKEKGQHRQKNGKQHFLNLFNVLKYQKTVRLNCCNYCLICFLIF